MMPSSAIYQVPVIICKVLSLAPSSVLDVGIGFGKYGYLLREYLDIMRYGYDPKEWRTIIDGIEVHGEYILDLHRCIYNNIAIGDALEVLPRLNTKAYDVLIAIDILEHFVFERGRAFLKECRRVAKTSIVCTPINFFEQGAVFNNSYETHRSVWCRKDFEFLAPQEILDSHGGWVVVF